MKLREGISLMRILPEPGMLCAESLLVITLLAYLIRNQLKASYLMSSEIQATLTEDIGMQVFLLLVSW